MGYYYNFIEARKFLENVRAGRAASMTVYEMDDIKNGFWPIYKGNTSRFCDSSDESKEEIENWLKSRA